MALFQKLVRGTKAFVKEISTPESFVSGKGFEDHVDMMFPKNEWKLIKKTHDYQSNIERFEDKSKEPDFLFQHIRSKRFVNIECKFRSRPFKDKIEWCKYYQFKRYKEIDNKYRNVYIILGFGGTATNPREIFRIPMSEIKYTALYPNSIRKYKVRNNHRFKLVFGKLK